MIYWNVSKDVEFQEFFCGLKYYLTQIPMMSLRHLAWPRTNHIQSFAMILEQNLKIEPFATRLKHFFAK